MRNFSFYGNLLCSILIAAAVSCKRGGNDRLYTLLPSSETGIRFSNTIANSRDFNIFNYRNFYNGAGVAIADINNDSLPDIYFTSNLGKNKLYLNKGGFRFEDISAAAGVEGTRAWSTGVAIADVNADGWLDIYVCNSGNIRGDNRENELFINNGDLTFSEKAASYGLADQGFGTHAAFFDYDTDGDLDCYVLNNSFTPIGNFGYRSFRHVRDSLGGDKLLRNDEGHFVNVSEEAGIYSSLTGFGLGVTVGDVNNDFLPDIYVSNDFFERDYLYINQGNGTFSEELEQRIGHTSLSSMGADMADLNNDGAPEIFVTDMLPENNYRLKVNTTFENWNLQKLKWRNDLYNQYTQNTLQLNMGNGTFCEIAHYAGVPATDWSWGALMYDADNDGLRDIFVCNGIYKDLTDQDFIAFLGAEEQINRAISKGAYDFREFLKKMPSTPLGNYAFKNKGGLLFENAAEEWGLAAPGFSNGAAYADLDNDGDLDLVTSNVNSEASVYRNNSPRDGQHHFLNVQLRGNKGNRFAIGTKVKAFYKDTVFLNELIPTRGFQSSVDYRLHFGLGSISRLDSMMIVWPDQTCRVIRDVEVNRFMIVKHQEGDQPVPSEKSPLTQAYFTGLNSRELLPFRHVENAHSDFDFEHLMPRMQSAEGPEATAADINGDGLDDLYICGAQGQGKRIFIQKAGGGFKAMPSPDIEKGADYEDADALFFDADGDGDQDLYIVSGGNARLQGDPLLQDRLYLNGGNGKFKRAEGHLPELRTNGACVAAADYDSDGDMDLFVGSRSIPRSYGLDPKSFLLENDGNGVFEDVTGRIAYDLHDLGMVTDAAWADIDKDGSPELLVVGEWMPVTVLKNNGKQLKKIQLPGLKNTGGWWNCITAGDIDGDGDIDFAAGNFGHNFEIQASPAEPAVMYVNDFDTNGQTDPLICYYRNGESYPMVMKPDLLRQLPSLKKKFLKYSRYGEATITGIFPDGLLQGSLVKRAKQFSTVLLINEGGKDLRVRELSPAAQMAPVNAISIHDFDRDGVQDILAAGNFFYMQPRLGRLDASFGCFLKGKGENNFEYIPYTRSGFFLAGQVSDLEIVSSGNRKLLVAGINNEQATVFEIR